MHKAKATANYPRVPVTITNCGTNKYARVGDLTDTQLNLKGWKEFQEAGFCKKDVVFLTITIRVSNKIAVDMLGVFKVTFSEMPPNKKLMKFDWIIYISDSVPGFILSYETIVDILIISKYFHTIGSQPSCKHSISCY